jgi:hypothetical protein
VLSLQLNGMEVQWQSKAAGHAACHRPHASLPQFSPPIHRPTTEPAPTLKVVWLGGEGTGTALRKGAALGINGLARLLDAPLALLHRQGRQYSGRYRGTGWVSSSTVRRRVRGRTGKYAWRAEARAASPASQEAPSSQPASHPAPTWNWETMQPWPTASSSAADS